MSGKPVIVRGSTTDRVLRAGVLVAVVAFAIYIPQGYSPYRVFQFTMVLVFIPAVLGLNLLTGFNGQISLGHSFFFGTGAYVSAVLIASYDWNYLATIPVAAAITWILGFLFGIPALRLHGLYLALVTLALAVVFAPLVKSKQLHDITNGSNGLVVPRIEAPGSVDLEADQWLYYVCLVVVVLLLLLAWNLTRSRLGRAMIALRDNPIAAETMGIRGARVKTRVFAFSTMYAGIAGSLYTFAVAFVSPESFTVTVAVSFLAAIVVGGLATVSGAIFGALFIQFMPFYAAEINKALSGVIYGAALIIFMFVMPGGFVGLLRRLRSLVVKVEGRRRPGAAPLEEPAVLPPEAPVGALREGAWQTVDERGRT